MTPLSPTIPSNISDVGNSSSIALPRQPVALRKAQYVKVVDLALMNKLDIQTLKVESEKRMEELKNAEGRKDDENSDQDDDIIESAGSEIKSYQKRIIPASGGFNLCLLVGNVKIVVMKTRVDKSQVRLAECEIGDESGVVSLRARDDQIQLLQEISERKGAVVLRNCNIELFQGKFIRLSVSKWGKVAAFPDGVSSTPPPPTMMNSHIHLSIVDIGKLVGDRWSESTTTNSRQGKTFRDENLYSEQNFRNQSRWKQNVRGAVDSFRRSSQGNRQRKNSYNKQKSSGPGQMNPNMIHTYSPNSYPGNVNMNSYQYMSHPQMYQMPNPYMQHNPQTRQEDYLRLQEYNMRMQMEAMRLTYQQAHHQEMPSSINPNSVPPDSFLGNARQLPARTNVNEESPMSTSTPSLSHSETAHMLSPGNAASVEESEHWQSMRLESQSPMMNPNAPTFTSSAHYNIPALSLPSQQFPFQNNAYSFPVHFVQGVYPGHSESFRSMEGSDQSPPNAENQEP